jgi:hypothetical protein
VLGKGGAHGLREDAAAPERDGVAGAGVGEQLAHDLLLGGAKGVLAAGFELVGDRVPEALLQQGVAVERPSAEATSELGGDGGLAGAHEADQDEGHPILSA